MKPFNLQEALAGKPVVTRDGRRVWDVRHFPSSTLYKLAAVVEYAYDNPSTFTEIGKYHALQTENKTDLFMASEKKEGWINIYEREGKTNLQYSYHVVAAVSADRVIHSSKASAEASSPTYQYGPRIACVRIEWEE